MHETTRTKDHIRMVGQLRLLQILQLLLVPQSCKIGGLIREVEDEKIHKA